MKAEEQRVSNALCSMESWIIKGDIVWKSEISYPNTS